MRTLSLGVFFAAPREQCLSKDDEEVMEILEKFDEVELDFEDDKILIRGPTVLPFLLSQFQTI